MIRESGIELLTFTTNFPAGTIKTTFAEHGASILSNENHMRIFNFLAAGMQEATADMSFTAHELCENSMLEIIECPKTEN